MELFNLLLTVIALIGVIIEICKVISKLIKFVSSRIAKRKNSYLKISLKVRYK